MTERLYNPQALVALCEALMLLPILLVMATRPPAMVRLLILTAQLLLANWVNKNVAMEDICARTRWAPCCARGCQ